jgi:hypothetical protein
MPQRPMAVLTGTLTVADGCLWIEAHGDRWLALWPTPVSVTGAESVTVEGDGVRVAEGDQITVVGGEYSPEHQEYVEGLIGQAVPEACRGLSWLVVELLPEPI